MRYKCPLCGFIYDEEKEKKPLKDVPNCPVCGVSTSAFIPVDEDGNSTDLEETGMKTQTEEDVKEENKQGEDESVSFYEKYERKDPSVRYMDLIHRVSKTGKPVITQMETEIPMPSWDDILLLGNQLNPEPSDMDADVCTTTIIGKNARKPMKIESPVYISHMSYGALSKESKIALSKGSAVAKTAMCSGEGGILPESRENAYKYIFEYVPNKYSVTDENLRNSDAIEIKIGQATKPGMGGLLPGAKVTEEIAEIRKKPVGEPIQSPSTFSNIKTKEDLKDLVDRLREHSGGRPVGIKIAANKLEDDLKYIEYAECDFLTVDGRGGSTAASPLTVRDSTSIPTIYALDRTRKYLDENKVDMDLVITGGLRVSTDFVKALSMGADAVAIATASLMAIGCQQYRVCSRGTCPMGITTQDKEKRKNFKTDTAAKHLANYLKVTQDEIKELARMCGHNNVHDFNMNDIATIKEEISNHTRIKHV